MKKKWFACGLICMLILASIAHAESISASLSGQIWNLDLTRSPMAYTDEGTIVLAGRDGNASPTDDTIEARLYCCLLYTSQGGKRRVRQVHRAVGLAGMENIAVQRQPIEQIAILMQIMEPEVIQLSLIHI